MISIQTPIPLGWVRILIPIPVFPKNPDSNLIPIPASCVPIPIPIPTSKASIPILLPESDSDFRTIYNSDGFKTDIG